LERLGNPVDDPVREEGVKKISNYVKVMKCII
jgi:hypothetical protein